MTASQTRTAAQMVAEAKGRVANLTPLQVASELAGGRPLLVDLREPEERAQTGIIPGAVAAPRGMLEFYADPASPYHREGFDPDRRTILYCAERRPLGAGRRAPSVSWGTPASPISTAGFQGLERRRARRQARLGRAERGQP